VRMCTAQGRHLMVPSFYSLRVCTSRAGGPAASREARAKLLDLYSTVCGGPLMAWSPSLLKVVVTCREGRLTGGRAEERTVFGAHRRRALLPFSDDQVRASMGGSGLVLLLPFFITVLLAASSLHKAHSHTPGVKTGSPFQAWTVHYATSRRSCAFWKSERARRRLKAP
jgi:hypothetical protein